MTGARLLFTCRPLAGHYEPLLPLATAARNAGHAVAFATGEPYDDRARSAGFEAFRVGPSEGFREEWAARFAGFERLVGDEQRNDPADLGRLPDDVLVRRYIPQADVLPHCQAVVSHGGAGTTLGALAHGLPLLVIPQGADQYANADAVVAAGAGRRLSRDEATAPAICDAVRALLDDPDLRRAAENVQTEIRAMPPAEHAIARIELAITEGRSGR